MHLVLIEYLYSSLTKHNISFVENLVAIKLLWCDHLILAVRSWLSIYYRYFFPSAFHRETVNRKAKQKLRFDLRHTRNLY